MLLSDIVGHWKLHTYLKMNSLNESGTPIRNVSGHLAINTDGFLSVIITIENSVREELICIAYMGYATFINNNTLQTNVIATNLRSFDRSIQSRQATLSGNRLTLTRMDHPSGIIHQVRWMRTQNR